MNVGMLWFDNDKRKTFEDKLSGAATYYERKYAIKPNVCFVNVDDFPGEINDLEMDEIIIDGITVLPVDETIGTTIQRDHLWLGLTDKELSETVYRGEIIHDKPKHRIS